MDFQEKWSLDCKGCGRHLSHEICVCENCGAGKIFMNKYISRKGFVRVSYGCNRCKTEINRRIPCAICEYEVDVALISYKKPSFFERLFLAH